MNERRLSGDEEEMTRPIAAGVPGPVVPPRVYVSFSAEINQQTTEALLGFARTRQQADTQSVPDALDAGRDVMNGLTIQADHPHYWER